MTDIDTYDLIAPSFATAGAVVTATSSNDTIAGYDVDQAAACDGATNAMITDASGDSLRSTG